MRKGISRHSEMLTDCYGRFVDQGITAQGPGLWVSSVRLRSKVKIGIPGYWNAIVVSIPSLLPCETNPNESRHS